VLKSLQKALAAKGAGASVNARPAPATRRLTRPPFKIALKDFAGGTCQACGKQDRIVFRPASRYGVFDAVLCAEIGIDARGAMALPSQAGIGAAKRMEVAGTLPDVVATCGHCGKPLVRLGHPGSGTQPAAAPSRSDDLANEAQDQLSAGKFNEAKELAQRALQESHRHPRALLVLAVASFRLRSFAEAIPILQGLKKTDRKFADANDADAWLGASYEAQGQLSEAASSFRNKLKSKPKDPSATLALARVLLLRDGPTGKGLELLRQVARNPLAKDRALVDPRLAPLRAHPAIRAALGLS
jgi:tetratricopeptide (TPR) repeat protein